MCQALPLPRVNKEGPAKKVASQVVEKAQQGLKEPHYICAITITYLTWLTFSLSYNLPSCKGFT